MRLKSILLSLCVLAFFSSCSQDNNAIDDPHSGGDKDKGTYLSVRIASKANVSRADNNGLEGESNINNLTAFVFDAVNNELVSITSNPAVNARYECEFNDIKAIEGRIKLLLISNAPLEKLLAVESYEQLESLLAELDEQTQPNLAMSTPVYTTESSLQAGYNYIGFDGKENVDNLNAPLWLTRLAARLDLSRIGTNFTRPELLGRTVTIHSISYQKVKTASHFFSVADWGVVEVDGHLKSLAPVRPGYVIDNENPSEEIYKEYAFYVMENLNPAAGDETRIVINATLNGNEMYKAETKTFSAVINRDGILNGYSHDLIKRNYVYRIYATLGDTSFEGIPVDPEKPEEPEVPEPQVRPLNLEVKVLDWEETDQYVEF